MSLLGQVRTFAKRAVLSAYRSSWRPNLVCATVETLLRTNAVSGHVLSIGAAAAKHDLLNCTYFQESRGNELLGINIANDQLGEFGNFRVIYGDAHEIPFEDAYFDCVICNSMLEHDSRFWLTLSEIFRVLKPRGLAIMGSPGFIDLPLKRMFPFLPGFGAIRYDLGMATLTYTVHAAPGDYYRFSEQAFKEVFFSNYSDVNVTHIMIPPRIIGIGRKP